MVFVFVCEGKTWGLAQSNKRWGESLPSLDHYITQHGTGLLLSLLQGSAHKSLPLNKISCTASPSKKLICYNCLYEGVQAAHCKIQKHIKISHGSYHTHTTAVILLVTISKMVTTHVQLKFTFPRHQSLLILCVRAAVVACMAFYGFTTGMNFFLLFWNCFGW